jgi:hypothetical protein
MLNDHRYAKHNHRSVSPAQKPKRGFDDWMRRLRSIDQRSNYSLYMQGPESSLLPKIEYPYREFNSEYLLDKELLYAVANEISERVERALKNPRQKKIESPDM